MEKLIDMLKAQKEPLYYQALITAFVEFIQEENQKRYASEKRLMTKIEAAKVLYQK